MALENLYNRKRTISEDMNSMITPLLQHMGFNELNQDPSTALANWNQVETRLYRHSEEASCLFGICYPLNLALANSSTPPPAKVIRALIECYPQALTVEDFGGACRSRHTSGEVLKVLMDAYPFEQRTNLVKRWDLDWIACNDNKDAARMLIHNCSAAKPSNFKEWREMRPSSVSCGSFFLLCFLDEFNSNSVLIAHLLVQTVDGRKVQCRELPKYQK